MNIDCLYPWSCPVFYVLISRIDMATSASLFLFFFLLFFASDFALLEVAADTAFREAMSIANMAILSNHKNQFCLFKD